MTELISNAFFWNAMPPPVGMPNERADKSQVFDAYSLLNSAGVRPTRHRAALVALLFGEGGQHLTAEMLFEKASLAKIIVSLATVYNTLNCLTEAGLLRRVCIDGSKTYFDTNVEEHQHFYLEDSHELIDIPDCEVAVGGLLNIPEGHDVSCIEIVFRIRKKRRREI